MCRVRWHVSIWLCYEFPTESNSKNFENWLTFGKVMVRSIVSCFLTHSVVYCVLQFLPVNTRHTGVDGFGWGYATQEIPAAAISEESAWCSPACWEMWWRARDAQTSRDCIRWTCSTLETSSDCEGYYRVQYFSKSSVEHACCVPDYEALWKICVEFSGLSMEKRIFNDQGMCMFFLVQKSIIDTVEVLLLAMV